MARINQFVDGATYNKLMQGKRQCRKCKGYFPRHEMVFTDLWGLVCQTCKKEGQQ